MGALVTVVVSVAGVVAAVWGLSVLGSEDAARDEIIGRLCVAGVSVIALIVLYLYWLLSIPAEWDAKSRAEIDELKARLSKRLVFMWRADDNKFFQEKINRNGENIKIGAVAVKNISPDQSIKAARVQVINYKLDGEPNYTTITHGSLLAHSTGRAVFDLYGGTEETLDILRIKEGEGRLLFCLFRDDNLESIKPGKYCIKVTASADEMARVDMYYFVDFKDYDHIEFRPWREGDTSHGPLPTPAEESRTPLPAGTARRTRRRSRRGSLCL